MTCCGRWRWSVDDGPGVAGWYSELYDNEAARRRIFAAIGADHARVTAALRVVTNSAAREPGRR